MTVNYTLERGRIIEAFASLEFVIDIYIARHFCTDHVKIQEMLTFVLTSDKMSFEKKKQTFFSLAKIYHPEMIKDNEGFNKALICAMDERNIFAHWATSTLNEKGKERKILIKRKPFDMVEYTQEEIEAILSNIKKCQKIITPYTNL